MCIRDSLDALGNRHRFADHDALRVKLAVADLQQIEGLKVGGLQRKHAPRGRRVRAAHFDSGSKIGRRDRFGRGLSLILI